MTPGSQRQPEPWAHHGIATLADGRLVTFAPDNSRMQIKDPGGRLLAERPTAAVTAHGVTVAFSDDDGELVWVADTGSGPRPDGHGGYFPWYAPGHGRVLALRLDGSVARELGLPPLPVYESQRFEPTAVLPLPAFDQIWVADGYGAGLVHRYATSGDYLGTAPASHDAAFCCPHAMVQFADEVLIADRENNRLVIVDSEGRFVRTLADGLRRPSCLAIHRDAVVVGELSASVALLDFDGRAMRRFGADETTTVRPSWPNALDCDGVTIAPPRSVEGGFNSPHAVAVDHTGQIHVVEWLIGGRHLRFDPDDALPPALL
ncbi:hypothetical protein [Streptomyces sp. NBC_00829]|uniref:hypothetical protein n=1 Tax=Streptomyces sp. NBC_00829 TaxID=2903679 RepID=UPI003864DAC8|nr:hypothetical protein OG293_33245 [Streptomyces sp. NBC_00829]